MNTATPRQFELLPVAPPADGACHVTAVGRRRDGRTRYWCLAHKADATGKYGRKLSVCRGAGIEPISKEETLALNLVFRRIQKIQEGDRVWPGLHRRIWSRQTVWGWHCAWPDMR
jgi:hypothetical protein